jgi:four helix bundle protein
VQKQIMATFSFEKLLVWKEACELSKRVYVITDTFPSKEKYGLISQLRRSSISASSNIAEGSGRRSARDKARFYEYAYSSLMEVYSQIKLSHELGYLHNNSLHDLSVFCRKLATKINRLHDSTTGLIEP